MKVLKLDTSPKRTKNVFWKENQRTPGQMSEYRIMHCAHKKNSPYSITTNPVKKINY